MSFDPAGRAAPIGLTVVGLLMLVLGGGWAAYRQFSFTDSASLASMLGLVLTVLGFSLTATGIMATARQVQGTLRKLAKRHVLGDVARASTLAQTFYMLCQRKHWDMAELQADESERLLSSLAVARSLEEATRQQLQKDASDISLVAELLRKIIARRGSFDGGTWDSLRRIKSDLSSLEARLRDVEAADA
jgi:hypothetical protein